MCHFDRNRLKMFIIRSKKYPPRLTRLLILFTLVLTGFFSVIWSTWWLNSKPLIQNLISFKLHDFAHEISKFNENFRPEYSESLPMPVLKLQTKLPENTQFSDTAITEFDSTYYYFLWDKYITEYGMTELDSLSIDSLIKIEMSKYKSENSLNPLDEDDSYSIKKDELLFVTGLKPMLKTEGLNSQDSLDYINYQDNVFTLEVWRSPLNFQGIKTTGNLITVFGITDFENITLYFISRNTFALKIKSRMYALKNDGKFYPFRELQIN